MSTATPPAKLLSQHTHDQPGKLRVTEYFFSVPLSYTNPTGPQLRLFARAVSKLETPLIQSSSSAKDKGKPIPWLAYLQGGPGFGCSEPQNSGFTNAFLDKGYQILLLDQRGFGLSNTLTAATLLASYSDPVAAAEYLSYFRADNSVRDFEAVRRCLTAELELDEDRKWSILGQSYGGFMATTYLSFYPEGLREAFICGGVPPVESTPAEVYTKLYARLGVQNAAYYARYPEDVSRVKHVVRYLQRNAVKFPDGGRLIPERFMSLGLRLGMHGGPSGLHTIITRAYLDLQTFSFLTRPTLSAIQSAALAIESSICYALLHEPLYLNGTSAGAANWSALRVRPVAFEVPDLTEKTDEELEVSEGLHGMLHFTAEQIFPSHLSASAELAPLKDVAEILARKNDWPLLYDTEQLKKNDVPIYALVYRDDLYVDANLALDTLKDIISPTNESGTPHTLGAGIRPKYLLTNSLLHNALGSRSEQAVEELWKLRSDVADLD